MNRNGDMQMSPFFLWIDRGLWGSVELGLVVSPFLLLQTTALRARY